MRLSIAEGINRAHPLNRGLIAWWLSLPNQARGVAWRDLVRGTNAALSNISKMVPSGARGRPGGYGCLFLTAGHGGAAVTLPSSVSWSSGFSWSAWCYGTSYDEWYLFNHREVGSGFMGLQPYRATTTWRSFLPIGGYTLVDITVSANAVPLNRWAHLVLTYKQGVGAEAFVNGVSVGSSAAATGALGYIAGSSYIGTYQGDSVSNKYDFRERMDDIRLWNRSLSSAEVRAVYRQSMAGHPDTLRWSRTFRAPTQQEATIYTYTPTGGAVSAGVATVSRSVVPPVSGGALSDGAATVSRVLAYAPAGGGIADGTAPLVITRVHVPIGGGIAAGAAGVSRTLIPPAPSGGAVSAGAAAFCATRTAPPPTGGGVSTGTATILRALVYTPTGGGQAAGAAALSRTLVYLVSGGATSGGAATTFSPSGIMDLFSDGHTALGPRETLDLYSDGHTPLLGPGGH